MSRNPPKTKTAADEQTLQLDENTKLVLSLKQSQIREAEAMLALRQAEMNQVTAALVSKYEENGEYAILNIDLAKGVTRKKKDKTAA